MNDWIKNFRWRDAALPLFATLGVLVLLFRLPNGLMDLLLSISLALSATIFLSTFFVRKPLDFSSFPTVLLVTTLFRLVLNVSTTRLILTQGDAGKVIDAFSRFVAGDNIVVGAVIFLIFVIIQFVVITKGATRISEVSARFVLDAMPGKQSAIDFDLNAGNITAEEAKAARDELAEQADFFGAMDGASKFVRGDAVAGLAIVAINLIGGLAIGVAQRGLSAGDAAEVYSKLTIGDGLVSQIPAFLISLATGLLVARSSRSQNISDTAIKQTFGRPVVLSCVGLFLAALALTGLPMFPLLTLACGCFVLAWATSKKKPEEEETQANASKKPAKKGKTDKKKNGDDDEIEKFLAVNPIELTIGSGLVGLADPDDGPSLLDRVRNVRQKIAAELGLILPKAMVRDDSSLDENQFSIKINGDEAALGLVYPNMWLAVETSYSGRPPRGLQTTAPDSGAAAYWIEEKDVDSARDSGFEVLSAGDVVERKTLEIARREAANLLSRDATKRLIERLRETSPAIVEEALGENEPDDSRAATARLAKIQAVLRLLLAEGVSIRRLDVALEALGDLALREPDSDLYRALEYVRARMARRLSEQYRDVDGELRVAMLEPEAEDYLRSALVKSENGAPALALSPSDSRALTKAVEDCVKTMRDADVKPILLVDRQLRYALRDAIGAACPNAAVLAYEEVDGGTKITQETTIDWKPKK